MCNKLYIMRTRVLRQRQKVGNFKYTFTYFSENISPNYSREKRTSLAKWRTAFYILSVTIKSFRHIIRRNYASSKNLDLTSAVRESKSILANLRSAWGEIYAFQISFFFFLVRDIQGERIEEDRERDAVISQVRAPALCCSAIPREAQIGSREIPSPRGTLPVFRICTRGVLAKHLNRPSRYASSSTCERCGPRGPSPSPFVCPSSACEKYRWPGDSQVSAIPTEGVIPTFNDDHERVVGQDGAVALARHMLRQAPHGNVFTRSEKKSDAQYFLHFQRVSYL